MYSKLYKLQQYEQMKSIIIKTSCISNKNKVVTNMYFWLCTTSVKSSVNKNILRCVLTIYAVNYFSNYNVYKLMLLLRVIPHWMSVVKIYKRTRLTVLCEEIFSFLVRYEYECLGKFGDRERTCRVYVLGVYFIPWHRNPVTNGR